MADSAEELPSGWESATSRATGETYYVNTRTGESQYEMPTADADGRSAAEVVQPSASAVIAAAEAEATAEAAKAKQAERLGKLEPEDSAPSPPADDATAAEGSARTRSLARGKALFGKAKTKAAAVSVSDSKAAALKHTSAVVSQSRKGLARAADGATNIGGVSHIVEKQRLKSDQQDAMMDHVVEMTEKCSQLQMELEDARTELEALRAQENADERVAELRTALAEAEETAQEAARQAAQTAEKAAQHAQQASDDAKRLEDARSQSVAELEELRNELAATRLHLRRELAECKAENERGMEVVRQELAEERLAHSALRARAAAGQAKSQEVLSAEKAAHEATRQEAAEVSLPATAYGCLIVTADTLLRYCAVSRHWKEPRMKLPNGSKI
jgi:DNA repair exonuclease SbcCD ATPase subunit